MIMQIERANVLKNENILFSLLILLHIIYSLFFPSSFLISFPSFFFFNILPTINTIKKKKHIYF